MRTRFDEQLVELNNNLITMSAYVETAIDKAIKALVSQNKKLAQETVDGDKRINQMEKDIESQCLKLILQQQPIARDLRQISTALKMVTDMERIGDHAADISEITILLVEKGEMLELEHIPQMAQKTIKMVGQAIDAYVRKDVRLAEDVIMYDDVVDQQFDLVRSDLIKRIRENSGDGEYAMNLLMIAKYLERIGDHAVNIAEWVIFSIEGKHRKVKSSL